MARSEKDGHTSQFLPAMTQIFPHYTPGYFFLQEEFIIYFVITSYSLP